MTASHQAPLNPLLKSPQRLSAKWLHFLLTLHCAKPPSDEPAIKVVYQVPSSLLGTTGTTPCPQQEAEAKSQGKCWSPGTLCLAPGGTENGVEQRLAPLQVLWVCRYRLGAFTGQPLKTRGCRSTSRGGGVNSGGQE